MNPRTMHTLSLVLRAVRRRALLAEQHADASVIEAAIVAHGGKVS